MHIEQNAMLYGLSPVSKRQRYFFSVIDKDILYSQKENPKFLQQASTHVGRTQEFSFSEFAYVNV